MRRPVAVKVLCACQGTLQAAAGEGIGRYSDSTNIDTTFYQDGAIRPFKEAQFLIGLELHPMPKLDINLLQRVYKAGANLDDLARIDERDLSNLRTSRSATAYEEYRGGWVIGADRAVNVPHALK